MVALDTWSSFYRLLTPKKKATRTFLENLKKWVCPGTTWSFFLYGLTNFENKKKYWTAFLGFFPREKNS